MVAQRQLRKQQFSDAPTEKSDYDIRSKTRTDADPEPKGEIWDRAEAKSKFIYCF